MKTKRSLRRTLASVAVAAVASTGAVVATAGTADAQVCGQYVYNKIRYYSHCGNGNIQVRILVLGDPFPDYICASPGVTYIGASWRYWDAKSTKKSC